MSAPEPLDLQVSPARSMRAKVDNNYTGIYVRARYNGRIDNYDIIELDRDSLVRWLKSRGGSNEWAENTVLLLLGHEMR